TRRENQASPKRALGMPSQAWLIVLAVLMAGGFGVTCLVGLGSWLVFSPADPADPKSVGKEVTVTGTIDFFPPFHIDAVLGGPHADAWGMALIWRKDWQVQCWFTDDRDMPAARRLTSG